MYHGISPLMYVELFSKKLFVGVQSFFGQIYEGVVRHRGNNDYIMPMWGGVSQMHFLVI